MRWMIAATSMLLLVSCGGPSSSETSETTNTTSPSELRPRLEALQERVRNAQELERRQEAGETLSASEQAELDQVHAIRDGVQQGFENSMDRRRREVIEMRLRERLDSAPEFGGAHGPVQEIVLQRDGEEIRYLGHAVFADGATAEVVSWSDGQNMRYDWRWPVE